MEKAGDCAVLPAGNPFCSGLYQARHFRLPETPSLAQGNPRQNFRYVYGWLSRPYAVGIHSKSTPMTFPCPRIDVTGP